MADSRWQVIDTNALIRLMTNDIPEQRKKVRDLLTTEYTTFFVHDLVISECLYVLQGPRYRLTRKQAIDQVRDILSISRIDYDIPIIDPALSFFETHPALSFVDCYLKAYAEDRKFKPIWTFDKKLVHQAAPLAREIK